MGTFPSGAHARLILSGGTARAALLSNSHRRHVTDAAIAFAKEAGHAC